MCSSSMPNRSSKSPFPTTIGIGDAMLATHAKAPAGIRARRPELFRLRSQHVRDSAFGKPSSRIGAFLSRSALPRCSLRMRGTSTRSDHIEKSSLKKQHHKAIALAKVSHETLCIRRSKR
jgi:hypothetical protein